MRARLLVGLAVSAAVVASTTAWTGAPASAAPGAPAPTTIAWSACDDPTLQYFGAECGLLTVPLDHAAPNGPTVQLALSRIVHTAEPYRGVMLVNPGGPGGSGQVFSFLRYLVPDDAGAAYDWIGFDPRGIGSSVPALTCDNDYVTPNRPPYVPDSPATEAAWLAKTSAYAADCAASDAADAGLLAHMRTTDNVRDMESIRQALASPVMNFYGFSYGTYLGQMYASMFPDKVGRMVLDSNIDPRRVFYQANLDQDPAFETVMKIWFGWIAEHDDAYDLGDTAAEVEQAYYDVLADVSATPEGDVGPAEWSDAFLYAGYVQFLWPDLADAFSQAVHGDFTAADQWWRITDGQGDDNGFAGYLATECTDAVWPKNWTKWRQDNWRTYNDGARFLTWANAWFNAPCLNWPVDGAPGPAINGGKVKTPILLVDETLDAATPYEGSLHVRRLFPSARLIALPGGTSHANSLAGDACLDDQIADYLRDGIVPDRVPGNGADATCEPLPLPSPNASAPTVGAASQAGRTALQLALLRARLGR